MSIETGLSPRDIDVSGMDAMRRRVGVQEEFYPLPFKAYTEEDQQLWQQWYDQNDFGSKKILALNSVNELVPPVRWLANIATIAQTLETVQQSGIKTPHEWIAMSPLHINLACNGASEWQIEEANDTAMRLGWLTQLYLDEFHPTLDMQVQLQIDNPAWVSRLMDVGYQLGPLLPDDITGDLAAMANKHNRAGDFDPNAGPAYLGAHLGAYGLLNGNNLGGFPERKSTAMFLPKSEERFLGKVMRVLPLMEKIGLHTVTLNERDNAVAISNDLLAPPYYAHSDAEPNLFNMSSHPEKLETFIHQGSINGHAKHESLRALKIVGKDLKGPDQVRKLSNAIIHSLNAPLPNIQILSDRSVVFK